MRAIHPYCHRNTGVLRSAVLLIFVCLLMLLAKEAYCSGKSTLYFFWSIGCPHCSAEKEFLEKLTEKYPSLDIVALEVSRDSEHARLFSDMADAFGITVKGVPATFIGVRDVVLGYEGDATSGWDIESRVASCITAGCGDPMERVTNPLGPLLFPQGDFAVSDEGICEEDVECPEGEPAHQRPAGGLSPVPGAGNLQAVPGEGGDRPATSPAVIRIPLLGQIDLRNAALPYQTIIIAGLDAFNPCAFFVLFTLLGILIHVHSRKRLLLVGGIFVFFSGFIYFLFMTAWLNVFLLTGEIAAVTAAAGIVALVIALINIKDFFFYRRGISLVIPEDAKPKLFDRMRKLIRETSLVSIIVGTVVLAVAANAYELFCTAGFPMVYTRILTLSRLSTAQYYLYLVLYNIVYVIPLAVIVLMFAITLGVRKLTEHQGQILKLISGMMMLSLGLVLLFRPDLLNNILISAGLLAGSLTVSAVIIYLSERMFGKNTGRT